VQDRDAAIDSLMVFYFEELLDMRHQFVLALAVDHLVEARCYDLESFVRLSHKALCIHLEKLLLPF